MAKDRTPEEGVPLTTRAKRLTRFGRGDDIELPRGENEKRDPRLPADPKETARAIREGLEGVRKLTKRNGNGRSKR